MALEVRVGVPDEGAEGLFWFGVGGGRGGSGGFQLFCSGRAAAARRGGHGWRLLVGRLWLQRGEEWAFEQVFTGMGPAQTCISARLS